MWGLWAIHPDSKSSSKKACFIYKYWVHLDEHKAICFLAKNIKQQSPHHLLLQEKVPQLNYWWPIQSWLDILHSSFKPLCTTIHTCEVLISCLKLSCPFLSSLYITIQPRCLNQKPDYFLNNSPSPPPLFPAPPRQYKVLQLLPVLSLFCSSQVLVPFTFSLHCGQNDLPKP